MSEKIHWLYNPNKAYYGHWDLPESGELLVEIKSAQWEPVENPKRKTVEEKRVVRFVQDIKPLICNETNARSIMTVTGTKFLEDSPGKTICLFLGSDRVGNETVDCVRVKAGLSITKKMLEIIWKSKKSKVNDKHKAGLERIIQEEITSSYKQAFDHLTSL